VKRDVENQGYYRQGTNKREKQNKDKKKTRRKKTNMLKKREKNYDVEIKEGKRRKKIK
jgi:hypothetical protein